MSSSSAGLAIAALCLLIAKGNDAANRGGCMYTLYSMRRSGNCYKVRLALAQLDIAHELVEIDILKGETRTPEFLLMNPSGHVPLLEVAPGRHIAEFERDPVVRRGSHPAGAGRPRRPRRNAAVDVLRAAQPGAEHRRLVLLADAGEGRARPAAARARGLDAGGPPRARRDGDGTFRSATSSPRADTPSPTSRSMPTRIWRTSATSICRRSRPSAPGCAASPISPATSRWTSSR